MGLDQYAYKTLAEIPDTFSNGSEITSGNQGKHREEIAYWRKHPNLEGWMRKLYYDKGGVEEFNCVNVKLDLDDLANLEQAVNNKELPETTGFFFGGNADDIYKEDDLKFIQEAREAISEGYQIYYTSWW